MIDKYFFDTDCLSAFLWARNENLLIKLYGGKIILPEQVYSELSHPRIPHLKMMTDTLKNNGDTSVENIGFLVPGTPLKMVNIDENNEI